MIQFDAEGGIRINGTPIPAQAMEKVVTSFADLARLADSWGLEFFQNDDDKTKARAALHDQRSWNPADAGNLARIAQAAEGILMLLQVALEPAVAQAVRERDDYLRRCELEAEALMGKREKSHGPCPRRVREKIMEEMMKFPLQQVRRRTPAYRVKDGVYASDRFADVRIFWPSKPPGSPKSKLRKEYDAWMRKAKS